jgi:hypothetical protein
VVVAPVRAGGGAPRDLLGQRMEGGRTGHLDRASRRPDGPRPWLGWRGCIASLGVGSWILLAVKGCDGLEGSAHHKPVTLTFVDARPGRRNFCRLTP